MKSDDVKAEVLYVKDDVRRMQGLYNPEKDKALKDFGDLKSQLGEFLASKIHTLETQLDDKVKRLEAIERSLAGGPNAPKINIIQAPGSNDQVTQQLATMKNAPNAMTPIELKKLEDSLRDHVDIL